MVTVQLMGGMGNQMFQYALAKHLALKNKTGLKIDLAFLLDRTPRRSFVYRDYDINVFNLDASFTFFSEMARFTKIPFVWFVADEVAHRLGAKLGLVNFVVERGQNFHQEVLNATGNIVLKGYWQSEKYFKDIENVIRKDFSFRFPLSPGAMWFAEKIRNTNAVCINVRRGDFITMTSSAQSLGFIGTAYYDEAIKYIFSKIQTPHFFVFSDEIEWCRGNLSIHYPHTFVGHEFVGPKFRDYLRLMTLCKHFIIPNSAFGWWAAWLSESNNKTVVAPKRWFKNNSLNSSDIIPERWIQL